MNCLINVCLFGKVCALSEVQGAGRLIMRIEDVRIHKYLDLPEVREHSHITSWHVSMHGDLCYNINLDRSGSYSVIVTITSDSANSVALNSLASEYEVTSEVLHGRHTVKFDTGEFEIRRASVRAKWFILAYASWCERTGEAL